MMFFKKRKKAATTAPYKADKTAAADDFFTSPPKATTSPRQPVGPEPTSSAAVRIGSGSSIAIADISQLVTGSGKPTRSTVVGEWFAFRANQIGISKDAVAAAEGDVFSAMATVTLLDQGQGDQAAQFGFGPIFYDAQGNVVRWFKGFEKPNQQASELKSDGRAPAGTVSVRLAFRGPKSDEESVYTVGARNLQMRKTA
jgi:hypothetical protein